MGDAVVEGEGVGDGAGDAVAGEVVVGEVGAVPVVREQAGEVGVGEGEAGEVVHVGDDDGELGGGAGGEGVVRNGELDKVGEVGKPHGGEAVERGGAGEGPESHHELLRWEELPRRGGAVGECESAEGRRERLAETKLVSNLIC